MTQTTLPRADFVPVMKERGFFKQCTDEEKLVDLLGSESVTGYCGFDPTADSLHIGSMVPIMGLVHLQRHGHRPVAIAGGGTAMVGDPSGKTELRKMLTLDQINLNLDGIKAQIAHFVDFGEGKTDGLMVNNADWLKDWGYLDFLREVGRHFSINVMLSRESVKQRLEHGMSFIEFNYMILQAYDFMMLNKEHGCRLQLGGDDQWGNIVSGIDLTRRMNRQEVYGLTFPLIATATGEKMGKTAAGAVWLDAKRTSPYDFFQYWVNVDDRDVERFLKLYTLLPMDDVAKLAALQGADIRDAKQRLAFEVTQSLHGEQAARDAEKAAAALFSGGGDGGSIPSSQRPAADLAGDGLSLIDALVDAGLAKSKGEARRLIRQGGIKINGTKVDDEARQLIGDDVQDEKIALQAGKKRHHHVKIEG
jgi:tyrosyl-tRNA synthetase